MRGETRFAILILVGVAAYIGFRSMGEGRGVERFLLRMGVLDDVTVFMDPPAPLSSGTAWHVGGGRWATALHVVDACSRIGVRRARGPRFDEGLFFGAASGADAAVITASDDAAILPLAEDVPERGERVVIIGFPQGRPARVAARYLGPAVVRMRGAETGPFEERQLLFQEISRTPDFEGSLGGLSGGPVLNARGEVIGVTSAEKLRDRQILASPVGAIGDLIGATAPGSPAVEGSAGAVDIDVTDAVRLTACVGITS